MESPVAAARQLRWRLFESSFALPEVNLEEISPCRGPVTPPITDSLYLPPFVGPSTVDDLSPLLSIIADRKPGIVLEFGTAYGATAANICALSDATVFTVNALPEQVTGNLTTFSLSCDEIGRVYRESGCADRVTQIYADTRDVDLGKWLSPYTVDLVIIDACHDADFVLSDFLTILPYVAENGIVLIHDVHPSMEGHLVDSYVACMYLRRLGYDVRHIVDTWWGVWSAARGPVRQAAHTRALKKTEDAALRVFKNDHYNDVRRLRYYAKRHRDAAPTAGDS